MGFEPAMNPRLSSFVINTLYLVHRLFDQYFNYFVKYFIFTSCVSRDED
jgi:hypothetical protein